MSLPPVRASSSRASLFGCVATFGFLAAASAQTIPAFPGAEGYGAFAKGGRGGDVYHVTNLNNSGTGSFADAIATVPALGRTIVFDVSGHIHVNKTTLSASKVTIAGQTAPGDGIGFKDGTFIISGDDVVIRHARFRYGKKAAGGDCIDLSSGTLNAILDQISIQFSTDENISSFSSPPENLTMQWSLNGWGLESHSCGGLWDQNHASSHHSLWAHNHTRNPKARPNGLLEWINNVTFDWDIGFIMGDSTSNAAWKSNVRGCYFLSPPGNLRTKALEKGGLQSSNGLPNFSLYLDNCLHDADGDGLLNGTDKGYGIVSGSYVTAASPFAGSTVPVTIDAPLLAFKKVLSKAGALRLDVSYGGAVRDEVDARMVNNVLTQTRNHISSETSLGLTNGGFGTLNSTPAPVDTDKDGMPDFHETALGWNAAAQDHNTALANSGGFLTGTTFMPAGTVAGYTRLEEYLHFLAIPHGTVAKNITGAPTSIQIDLRKFTTGFVKSPAFTITNALNGTTTQSGTGDYLVTFTPTLNYVGRAKFDFTVTDSDGSAWTQTCALLVAASGLPRDLVWKGSAAAWDGATPDWLRPLDGSTVAFSTGDRVAFDQSGIAQPGVTLTGSLAPATVEVNATGSYAFSGTGSISSTGTLTKRGTGTLTLNAANTYTGGVSLEAGTLAIGTGGGIAGGAIAMLDGTTFTNSYPTGTSMTLSAPIDVPAGHAATLNSGNRLALSGALTGAGTLNCRVQTTVNRFDFSNATAAFAGNLNFTNSGGVRLFFNGGSFNGFDAASVDVGGNVSLQPQTNSGGNTLNIGALSGSSSTASLAGGTAGAVAYLIGANGADTTFAGAITGNATLTKTGGGTLTLGGACNYTGATAVNAGALLIDGSLGNTAITIASGAMLGGDGAIGGMVTANSGAFISPGIVPFTGATLSVGSGLSLTATTLYFDMAGTAVGTSDKIVLSGGTLALSGTLNFQFALLEGTLAAGTYDLVTGATNSTASAVVLTHNLPIGTRQTFTVNRSAAGSNPSKIWLDVVGNPATLTWTGATAATWDTTTANNWIGATPNTFGANDAAIIDDTATATTITPTGTVAPRSTFVNNSTKAFTLAAGIGGGVLTKSGAQNLTLTGANTHSATVLNAGTILLANATANAGGLGAGPVTLNGGYLKMYSAGDATSAGTLPNTLNVAGTATFEVAPRCGFSGAVTGAGTLNYFTTYVRADITGDWSAFSGTVNVISDAGGGDFRIAQSYSWPGLPAAAVNLAGNTAFYHAGILNSGTGTTITIGALSGVPGSHLRGGVTGGRALTYRIGSRNTDATFAGDIAEQNTGTTTAYVKTGTGTWELSGVCNWNGSTSVEAGKLKITGSVTCGGGTSVADFASLNLANGSLATDALAIATSATFTASGNATLTGDFNNDGTATIAAGTFAVSGDVVNNGTMRFTGGAQLTATGGFVNNGVLDLLTGAQSLPPNLENNGVVIDSRSLGEVNVAKAGNVVTITVQGFTQHTYQLQRSDALASPNWVNVGSAQTTATNGQTLTFTDNAAAVLQRYYRFIVSP